MVSIAEFKQAFAQPANASDGLQQRDTAVAAALKQLKQSIDQRPEQDASAGRFRDALKRLVERYAAARKGMAGADAATELDKILTDTTAIVARIDAPVAGAPLAAFSPGAGPVAAPAPSRADDRISVAVFYTVLDDRSGAPIKGAKVDIHYKEHVTNNEGRVFVSLDGNFTYNAHVWAESYSEVWEDLKVGTIPVSRDIRLTKRWVRVTIRVVDATTGQPVKDAWNYKAKIGATGIYSSTETAYRNHTATIVAHGYSTFELKYFTDRDAEHLVRLVPIAPADLVKVVVPLKVVMLGSPTPVRAARVTIRGESVVTDSEGVAKATLVPGKLAYKVQAKGFVDNSGSMDVFPSNDPPVGPIELVPLNSADLHVRIEFRSKWDNASGDSPIIVQVDSRTQRVSGYSDIVAHFSSLPFGRYQVKAERQGEKSVIDIDHNAKSVDKTARATKVRMMFGRPDPW